jgi:hypothetical protein
MRRMDVSDTGNDAVGFVDHGVLSKNNNFGRFASYPRDGLNNFYMFVRTRNPTQRWLVACWHQATGVARTPAPE